MARQVFDRATRTRVATIGGFGRGSGRYQLNLPICVAVDGNNRLDGRVYVCDISNHRVQVYQVRHSYRHVMTLGGNGMGPGPNQFRYPRGVAVDPREGGLVYVADEHGHRVQAFSKAGELVRTFGVSGEPGADARHLDQPNGVAVGGDPPRLFVSDSQNRRVVVFDAATGACVATIGGGERGSGLHQFGNIGGVCLGGERGDEELYVADYGNHRVLVFRAGPLLRCREEI